MNRRPSRPRNTRGPKRPMFKLSFNYSGGGGFDPACREPCICVEEEPRALSMAEIETKRQAGEALSMDDMLAIAQFDNEAMSGALEAREAELEAAAVRVDQGKKPVTNPPAIHIEDYTEKNFSKGEHYYTHLSDRVCKAGEPGCSLADVVDVLNKRAAHPKQIKPFVPGQYYKADVAFFGPLNEDPIETVALYNEDEEQHGLRNITLEGHLLHPGTISRYVVLQDGWFHILTVGEGAGKFGGPNILGEDIAWDPIDQRVIDAFRQQRTND